MDWKDTVMDAKGITEAINRVYPSGTGTYQVNVADRAIAKSQAEISFPAGEKQGIEKGIRKVVERYKEDNPFSYNKYRTYWNNLKKEWGIKEGE